MSCKRGRDMGYYRHNEKLLPVPQTLRSISPCDKEEPRLKRLTILITLVIVLTTTIGAGRSATAQEPIGGASQAAPGEYLITWRTGTRANDRAAALQTLGGQVFDQIAELGVEAVRFRQAGAGTSPQATADLERTLAREPLIATFQPNYLYHATNDVPATTGSRRAFLPLIATIGRFVPNDPALNLQYAWDRIQAFNGWSISRGSASTVVAIVDSGVQLDHPDLVNKLVSGIDLVEPGTPPDDRNGHGTHVAGIVAAQTNNGIGVAGTCPACRIMPVRVLNDSGSGTDANVANGIIYAANNGAKVINMSLGGPNTSAVLENAVNYAWSKGVLVACAAGNDGQSTPEYPAGFANCLSVGATDSDDNSASYSNYGTWVDLAAPGSAVYSTYINSSYEWRDGTSMATPYVAGVAGLLASQGLTNAQIRDRLYATADRIPGTGARWSHGRLNLLRAVSGY